MSLESATYIDGLIATNPTNTDPKAQGDDHIRLLKATIKATWPNINGAVTVTPAQINVLATQVPATAGGTGIGSYTAGDMLRAASSTTLEKRTAAQVRGDIGADNATNLASGTVASARLPSTIDDAREFTGAISYSAQIRMITGLTALVADGVNNPRVYRSSTGFPTPGGFAAVGSLVVECGSSSTAAGFLVAAGEAGINQTIVFGVKSDVVRVIGDGIELRLGGTDDFALYHDGTENFIDSNTGSLKVRDSGGTVRAEIGTAGVLVTPASGPASSEVGFRKVVRQTTGGTLTAAMNGTCQAVSSAVTVDNSVHAAGDAIQIYNNSASPFNITQGSGVTMRLAGTTTTGTRSLAPRGFAYLWFNSASEVIVSGNVS